MFLFLTTFYFSSLHLDTNICIFLLLTYYAVVKLSTEIGKKKRFGKLASDVNNTVKCELNLILS